MQRMKALRKDEERRHPIVSRMLSLLISLFPLSALSASSLEADQGHKTDCVGSITL